MSTTEPPTDQVPSGEPDEPEQPARSGAPRSWRSRLTSRGAVIGYVVAALVIIGGITVALLVPNQVGHTGPPFGPPGWGGPFAHAAPGGPMHGDDRFWRPGHGGGPFGGRAGGAMSGLPVITGTVASVSGDSLVLNVDGAGQRTLRVDDDMARGGPGSRPLGQLQTGERVVVGIEGSGDSATVHMIWTPKAHVGGTVTAASGDTLTVSTFEGLTATVDVSGLAQKPVAGDVVFVVGTAATPTSIHAESVQTLPKAS